MRPHNVAVERTTELALNLLNNWVEDITPDLDCDIIYQSIALLTERGFEKTDPLFLALIEKIVALRERVSLYYLALGKLGQSNMIQGAIEESLSDDLNYLTNPREVRDKQIEDKLFLLHSILLSGNWTEAHHRRLMDYDAMVWTQPGLHSKPYLHAYLFQVFNRLKDEESKVSAERHRRHLLDQISSGKSKDGNLWLAQNHLLFNMLIALYLFRSKPHEPRDLETLRSVFSSIDETFARKTRFQTIELPDSQWYEGVVAPKRIALLANLVYARLATEVFGLKGPQGSADSKIRESQQRASGEVERKVSREFEMNNVVRRVVADSLQIRSNFTKLSGGLSGAEVFSCRVQMTAPFEVGSRDLILKMDIGTVLGHEYKIYHELVKRSLAEFFARVSSEGTQVKIQNESVSVLLYEQITGYQTLRSLMESDRSREAKRVILREVFRELLKMYKASTSTLAPEAFFKEEVSASFKSHIRKNLTLIEECASATEERTRIESLIRLTKDALQGFAFEEESVVPTVMHGDLHLGNILVPEGMPFERINSPDFSITIKLIDFHTLSFTGSYLLDFGQLLQDIKGFFSREDPIMSSLLSMVVELGVGDFQSQRSLMILSSLRSVTLKLRLMLGGSIQYSSRRLNLLLAEWESYLDVLAEQ